MDVLKREQTVFPDRLDIGNERKGEIKDYSGFRWIGLYQSR